MNNSFPPSSVQPNQPLRKPSSSPVMCPFPGLVLPAGNPVRPHLSQGAGPDFPPARGDTPAGIGSMQSSVPLCHFCSKQGNLRCTRCKKATYCSGVCQMKDWDGHRQICIPAGPEPAKKKPNQTAALPSLAHNTTLPDLRQADAVDPHRVYLKDLHTLQLHQGKDVQASVVEFYSPGRFFLLVQNPDLLKTLQSISSQLQKTPSCPSVPLHVPCVGEVCAAQFSADLIWYRGLVQKLAADKKSAHILYIDYGNEEDVPVDRMRPLPADLEPFHPCAMECRVAGVEPLDGSWSAECCSAVKPLLAGRVVTVKLVETLKNVHAHAVDIELPMGKRLSSLLIDGGFVKKAVDLPTVNDINAMLSASSENYQRQSQGKDDNTWARPPEALTQAVGDSFSVVITHFHSPDKMIVQKVDNAGVIQELQLSLRQHCNQLSAPQDFRPAPSTICCAQFSEDKQWYRAKVLAYPSEARVCVGYIDFGNSEDVDIGHLRPLSPSLLALPMQAIPCGLAGIQPVGGSWSEESLLALQRRVCNRILRVEIEGAHEGQALVVMVDETSDPQDNIAELLISAGYASPIPAAGSLKADNDPQAEQAPPEPAGPTFPVHWKTVELPIDESFKPDIAAVTSPSLFYLFSPSQDQQKLREMMQELATFCSSDRATLSSCADKSELVPGAACCAQFTADDTWYRAVVVEVGNNEVAVVYADYGNTENLPVSRILPIPKSLLQLPFMIARCALTGREHFPALWPREVLQMFLSLLLDGIVATALSFDGFSNILTVSLPAEKGGVHLSALILDALESHKITSAPSQSAATEAEQMERSDITLPQMTPAGNKIVGNTAEETVSLEQTAQSPQQRKTLAAEFQKNAPASACCCLSVEPEMQRLERMIERVEHTVQLLLSSLTRFTERLQI
ncbi:tudor domain-containing protein 1 isoform X3 [Hippocampus comes]|uniref:tudor domain-containing protein 1 isoform X3 n=1 Tax=Hippocampus comes TaxID=109280 RepID=UPI00094E9BCE|nr:PREDICTED: tudor domain-containing protein 1 isoform X3 [Hippocampus comes]